MVTIPGPNAYLSMTNIIATTITTITTKMKTVAAPKKKAPARFPRAEKNIIAIYQQATADELQGGLDWYEDANNFCKAQARIFGLSLEVVAGIVSSLSPGTDWERNKADAVQVMKGNTQHKCGTYGQNVEKARRICAEATVDNVAGFFPADKTFNFYHNIINPALADYVTVDRHALSVALGAVRDDKSITKVEYRELATAYRKAAKKLGILPAQCQAVTWVVWRNAKGMKSKYTLQDMLAQRTNLSLGQPA